MYKSIFCSSLSSLKNLSFSCLRYSAARHYSNKIDEKKLKCITNLSRTLQKDRIISRINNLNHEDNITNNTSRQFLTEEILPYIIPENIKLQETDDNMDFVPEAHKPLKKSFGSLRISYYISLLRREIENKNFEEAYSRMLLKDRVMPTRTCFHLVIDSQINAKNSEKAFKAYKKMRELDIEATQATYSRLFRACSEELKMMSDKFYSQNILSEFNENYSRNKNLINSRPHQRTLGLWTRIREKKIPMTVVTCNSLLTALARAGDIRTCLRAIDEWKFHGTIDEKSPFSVDSKTKENLFFRPDGYTLNALLIGVASSDINQITPHFKSRFHLALKIWHLITPMMKSKELDPSILTVLAHIFNQFDEGHDINEQNLLMNTESVDQIDRKVENLLNIASRAPLNPLETRNNDLSLTRSTSNSLLFQAENCLNKFYDSGVNLLSINMEKISCINFSELEKRSLLPWQRLALCGGLKGFLDMASWSKEPNDKARSLFTRIAGLLPYFDNNCIDSETKLDTWESLFFKEMSLRNIKPDLPIFNVLIMRRSRSAVDSDPLLKLMNEKSIYADIITWSCIANRCRTLEDVKSVLNSYSKAIVNRSQSKAPKSLKGNHHLYSAMLNGTLGNSWRASQYILAKLTDQNMKIPSNMLYRIEKSIHEYRMDILLNQSISDDKEKQNRKNFKAFIKTYKEFLQKSA